MHVRASCTKPTVITTGKDGDVLVIQAPTRALNTTVPQEVIDRAYADDEASARAEFGAQFRLDVESFVSRDAVDKAVIPGRFGVAPRAR